MPLKQVASLSPTSTQPQAAAAGEGVRLPVVKAGYVLRPLVVEPAGPLHCQTSADWRWHWEPGGHLTSVQVSSAQLLCFSQSFVPPVYVYVCVWGGGASGAHWAHVWLC